MIIKFQIMYSNKEKTNSLSTDNDNLKSSQNSDKKKGVDKDKESEFDIERESEYDEGSEQSEASRYNEEEYIDSKHVNKHDQATEQNDLPDKEKAARKRHDAGNKNRVVN